ncbi:heavy metal translocating P-type ATPase metal-binding domain-containing protein [Tenacibaculum finnmarkense genomovar ulcerans]|uniref:heavy metal translocating P-type ATPase n=1 Tax=Tenacibaculum finnmarkense TaxID=2781243 RepID=UPI00187B9AA4|nr:heavy metal translocating P-type ATPase metal-binding domain-containing protein [Tenacibaculum finnmarkense]MBE7687908.1 HAD-IC family P-type ATPase [Tenacibaculum finnmarkense genomovar ulcerans]MCD8431196.1 heavy metal translocating P-type ATPase metal-binding domain-containing protein [Tenacibaculum finnmarkense genomovar ulcerans]MCD8444035.1 heavy metal translocating P-type ATPase metal-binding domain-containing protein [Tenacibaculum finnmarkense genomovar ulcerans]MCG8748726.1 HAD-IC 
MENTKCFHCGNECDTKTITIKEKSFCCNGCKTVFEIFSENDLTCYYDFQNNPGAIPEEIQGKYDFLDNASITDKLLEFNDGNLHVVNLYIPHIHCSSCIWVLENVHKLQRNISSAQVDFPKKTVRITYNSEIISLKEIVLLLSSIGYEPYISLEDYEVGKKKVDRSLIYKLGIAGFSFGNVMFLSFPEYFEVTGFWLEQYKGIFRWLMFFFSLPVVFYAGQDYFISAYKGLRSKILNIDVPIALGIAVLFIRSSVEIIFDIGTGFFDSLTGLVFFLLLGKFFQQKTYNFLSFERDYKSYFPIAVTRISSEGKEENVQIYDVEKGDRLLIRNQELIPVDGILINGNAKIDYSFVTGEAVPVIKKSGDKLFAGGKQLSGVVEMEVLSSVSQSYLTQLWSNDVFKKDKNSSFKTLTDRISQNFTVTVLIIAFISTAFWLYFDSSKALNVFTAVLIIACPCAIALAAPFTLGNMLRILGKKKFYLKNATVVEQLAAIDTVIFDKTGTLTTSKENQIEYKGSEVSSEEKVLLKSVLRASNHPLSRMLYGFLSAEMLPVDSFKEYTGKGIEARCNGVDVKIGSSSFVNNTKEKLNLDTSVHSSFDGIYKGKYVFKNAYRNGVKDLFSELNTNYNLAVVSGDNEGEKKFLEDLLPKNTSFLFNQKPEDKLNYVENLQNKGESVIMIGDGLNDAGALAQSNVGISLSENINVFSPACDAILDASKFNEIGNYIKVSKKAIKIIKYSFILSLCYNLIGLYFATTGQLKPVIAAILMPLSSISIVLFTTIATNLLGKKIK